VAARHFGLDRAALLDVTRTAIGASFADADLKRRLGELVSSDGPGV
jgi:adenosine deaminase